MGNHRSGRKPSPFSIGNPHADLQFTPGLPPAPLQLLDDALALDYYLRIGAQLEDLGVMTHEYADILATLAAVSADWQRAREQHGQLGRQGFHTEKRRDGSVRIVENPMLKRISALAEQRTRLLAVFGLTPNAKIARKVAEPQSKWDALINGRGA